MLMSDTRVSVKRTVFYDKDTGSICTCSGNFWKTCALRVSSQLPCVEAIVSITPLKRKSLDLAPLEVRSVDKALSGLNDQLRSLKDQLKI